MSRTTSSLAWAVCTGLMGALAAYSMHARPDYCVAFPSFCRLPPSGYGFYSVCVAAMLLLGGSVDLMRDSFMHREVGRFAKWQTIISAVWLLLWLWAGFRSGVATAL